MTEKSSGDKCTQTAGISVPGEESTYAPSIRKMICPPRELTAKAQKSDNENSPSEVRKGEKQVETRSKSTIKASQRKDKASGKMRRSRPRDKRSRRPPKSRDEGFRIKRRSTKRRTERDHQKSTEPRWQSTTDLSLSRRRSNEFQKGGDSRVYTIKSYRQSSPTDN